MNRTAAKGYLPSSAAAVATTVVALLSLATGPLNALAADPVRIAVFELELDDRSAGGAVIGPDARDAEYLRQTTDEARRMLAESGHFVVVDTDSVAGEVAAAGGIRHCNGCDGPLALRLGAEQTMLGVLTRVSRTEYTLQLVFRDARTGTTLSDDFSGLRMGANYSWPRGVKYLMTKRILPAASAR